MRHLAQNQYLPWTSSVMKIPYGCSVTTGICVSVHVWRGVALSATEGGVNKRIACQWWGDCLWGGERVRWMLSSTAEGRQGKNRHLLPLLLWNYSDMFVLSGAVAVCACVCAGGGQRQTVYLSGSSSRRRRMEAVEACLLRHWRQLNSTSLLWFLWWCRPLMSWIINIYIGINLDKQHIFKQVRFKLKSFI